jgi:group I intron endonuclease
MMNQCGIYLLRNSLNGKVYVGQSVQIEIRFLQHKRSAKRGDKSHLYDAIRKYGDKAFTCEVLEECEPELFDEKESHWMLVHDCRNPERGYNFMPAGQNGRIMDAKMRAILSEKSRGYKQTPEAIEKIRIAATGKTHTPETKAKISAANKGRKVKLESSQATAKALAQRWANLTQEEKTEYANKRSGWKQSEQVRMQTGDRFRGVPKSADQRANMSAAAKSRDPERDAKRLAALAEANKRRWEKYRLQRQEAVCCL